MKKNLTLFFLGFMVVFSAYASNSASIDYVDNQIAILKAEILDILNGSSQ